MKNGKDTQIGAGTEESQKIGNIIKELRLMKKWKQADVAKMLGIPLTTYNAYELGYNRQHAELIKQLAEIYNVTTDRILGVEEKQYKANSIITVDKDNIRQVYTLTKEQFTFVQIMLNTIKMMEK